MVRPKGMEPQVLLFAALTRELRAPEYLLAFLIDQELSKRGKADEPETIELPAVYQTRASKPGCVV